MRLIKWRPTRVGLKLLSNAPQHFFCLRSNINDQHPVLLVSDWLSVKLASCYKCLRFVLWTLSSSVLAVHVILHTGAMGNSRILAVLAGVLSLVVLVLSQKVRSFVACT